MLCIQQATWSMRLLCLQVGDAAHAAYVDGTGLALSLEDAAMHSINLIDTLHVLLLCLQVGDAAHAAYVDGTGLALSLEDAAVLAWHVQQQGLTADALRAYEAERIPRVKAVFGLTSKQAAAMKAGVPQRQLLDERAELLYGQAHFKPLQPMAATAAAAAQ
jgi:2-polyprenyl-6-methoxyphenol hydroxylase-like FAD-dependent oxidoreductase